MFMCTFVYGIFMCTYEIAYAPNSSPHFRRLMSCPQSVSGPGFVFSNRSRIAVGFVLCSMYGTMQWHVGCE